MLFCKTTKRPPILRNWGFFIAVFGTWIVCFVSRNFLLYDFFGIFAEKGVKMYKNRYNERKILAVFSVDGKKRK